MLQNKSQPKVVVPRGADLLAANIDRVNKVLARGSDKARLEMADWHTVAYCVTNQKGLIVYEESR
jgi:hypothetical protein